MAYASDIRHAHLHHKVGARGQNSAQHGQQARGGFKAIAYYVSWAIYGRNWPPLNIQATELTHLHYAFAGIDNKTGAAYLTDEFADIQKQYPGDNNKTGDLYGNLKQIYQLKKTNRNMKTLLSIGGWNLRTYFAPALANAAGRAKFAKTSVQLLADLGFDGLDIDWEYPNSTKEAGDLVDTCRLFRQELDDYSRNATGGQYRFLLTLAVPAGPDHFKYFDVPGLLPYVDLINLMAYDYQGSFSNHSGHNSNMYKSQTNPKSTDFDTQTPIDYYLGAGWPRERFNLGMPIYGRSFANTAGPGTKFTNATDGSWEPGVWDYKVLPLNGTLVSPVYHDDTIIASWCYSNRTRYMVSYDDPTVAKMKAQYINTHQLGGAMWWETSGDHPLNDSRSLIRTVVDEFKQCGQIEQCDNWLDYRFSKYCNMREGMP
ncbi:glycoside hydrolase family 18 protein [Dothistroma septosporum NZE10]|uniref:chitinase n=1 Tax=Dothistroma septosporum (strain NZE10 / CBS 128990) TaxID=675120 RepID=N1PGB2_DOTSN|nr:glycoside hydrolase family 18 protein [Dothistroma septosporum NZE10]